MLHLIGLLNYSTVRVIDLVGYSLFIGCSFHRNIQFHFGAKHSRLSAHKTNNKKESREPILSLEIVFKATMN